MLILQIQTSFSLPGSGCVVPMYEMMLDLLLVVVLVVMFCFLVSELFLIQSLVSMMETLPIMLWLHLSLLSRMEMLVTISLAKSLLSTHAWVQHKGESVNQPVDSLE